MKRRKDRQQKINQYDWSLESFGCLFKEMQGFCSQGNFCEERIWLSWWLLQREDLALKPAFAKRRFVPLRQERIWLSRVRFGSQAVIYLLLSYSFPFFWDSFSFFMPGHFSISHFTLPFYLSYFLPLRPLNHNS